LWSTEQAACEKSPLSVEPLQLTHVFEAHETRGRGGKLPMSMLSQPAGDGTPSPNVAEVWIASNR
jgi:hypothetical protein